MNNKRKEMFCEIKKKYERNKKEVPILPELLFCFKLSCFEFIILSFFNV